MTITKPRIFDIPNYSLTNHGFFAQYANEAKAINRENIQDHVNKWHVIWELNRNKPEHVDEMDRRIVQGLVDWDEAVNCIRAARAGPSCKHAPQGLFHRKKRIRKKKLSQVVEPSLCAGMEIFMPWSILQAIMVSNYYGVPDGVAIHQLYCEGPHDHCF